MGFSYNQTEIIKSFINGKDSNIYFLGISKSMMGSIPDIAGNEFAVIDLKNDVSPFKPFLQVLSDLNPPEKLIEELSFSVQTKSFISYFKNGTADERYDLPIGNEFDYEKSRFIKTIVSLLEKLSTGKYLIMNAQNIFSDSVALIKEIEKSDVRGKFVFCYDGSNAEVPSSSFMNLIDEFGNKPNFLHITDFNFVPVEKDKKRGRDSFFGFPEQFEFDEIIKALRNNRTFISVEQLKYLSSRIGSSMKDFVLLDNQIKDVLLETALAYNTCGLFDEAILFLSDIFDSKWDDEQEITALFCLAEVFFRKKSNDIAEKYLTQLYQKLEEYPDSPYCALAAMIDYQFTRRSDSETAKAKYRNALRVLSDFGLFNNFISLGLSVPWELINEKSSRQFIEETIEKCYRLALKIDNRHLVSSACHWKGIIHSHYGEGEDAMRWYGECNRIRTEIGEIGPLLNIRNGLCYESLCRALYKDAYNLVNEIIPCLYERNDYSCVIDTLKNISYALFYSRHFSQAYEIFKMNLHFLHAFNMENQLNNSFLPSVNDILLYKTIVALDSNDIIHARINYSVILQDKNSVTNEEKPLIYYVEAVLAVVDKDLETADSAIKTCVKEFRKIKSLQAHKIVFVLYEFANVLKKNGFEKESEVYLKSGFEIAVNNGFEYYTKGKTEITLKDYFDGIIVLDELKINLSFLTEKAEKDELMIQLHKKILDYQFLNKIKTGNIQNMSLKKYIESSILSIYEYTSAAGVLVCEKNNDGEMQVYSISREKVSSVPDDVWASLFSMAENDGNDNQIVFLEKYNLYFGNLSQYDYKFVLAVLPGKSGLFSSDTITTLNIALFSIQAQIVIYKQNENLLLLSSTDQLSMLNNRHALSEYILIESEKVRRYMQRKSMVMQIAVAFIDLDNFKYYNDNFGHEAGDLLIARFADLLSQTCRKVDFIARFGGDEFVVVMVDTAESEGIRVYERLRENLVKSEFFIPDLKKKLRTKTLEIPEKCRLGFSMGISTNFDIENPYELEKVIRFADKALYYSKENKKGSVTVWNDIKDIESHD